MPISLHSPLLGVRSALILERSAPDPSPDAVVDGVLRAQKFVDLFGVLAEMFIVRVGAKVSPLR